MGFGQRKRGSDTCAVFVPAAGATKQGSVMKASANDDSDDGLDLRVNSILWSRVRSASETVEFRIAAVFGRAGAKAVCWLRCELINIPAGHFSFVSLTLKVVLDHDLQLGSQNSGCYCRWIDPGGQICGAQPSGKRRKKCSQLDVPPFSSGVWVLAWDKAITARANY